MTTGQLPKPRILLLDPAGLFPGLRECLGRHDFEVSPAGIEEARRLLATEPLSMVLLAGPLDEAGEGLVRAIKEGSNEDSFVPVVVLLDGGDVATRVRTLRLGADECIDGHVAEEELFAKVEALLRIKSVQDRMSRARQQLQRLSTTDALTGVLNRKHFEERVREELRRAKRYHDPVSLLVVDIDAFQKVNLEHGEAIGSDVLRAFARLLMDAVRDVDLVGRLSADTFCLLLPATHLSGALTVAERVRRVLSTGPLHVQELNVKITATIGVAFFPSKDVVTQEDLLRLAREALYRARKQGPGRVGLYQGTHYVYQGPDAPDSKDAVGDD